MTPANAKKPADTSATVGTLPDNRRPFEGGPAPEALSGPHGG
jgi:hypothetical protein